MADGCCVGIVVIGALLTTRAGQIVLKQIWKGLDSGRNSDSKFPGARLISEIGKGPGLEKTSQTVLGFSVFVLSSWLFLPLLPRLLSI